MAQLACCCSSSRLQSCTDVFQRSLITQVFSTGCLWWRQTGAAKQEKHQLSLLEKKCEEALLTSVREIYLRSPCLTPRWAAATKKEKMHRRHQALCFLKIFYFPATQERPHVQVRRGGLRKELLRAPEAAGSHEDSQRREALHLQGEELWQEVHHGWKLEEPPAHTHRWVGGKSRRWWPRFIKAPNTLEAITDSGHLTRCSFRASLVHPRLEIEESAALAPPFHCCEE